jgi:anti-sigma B factor antagonist
VERSSGAAPPRPPLGIEIERPASSLSIVSLAGELDLSTIPQVEAGLLDEIQLSDIVVVDLTRLVFIDSSGIGLLIKAHREMNHGEALRTIIARGSQVDRVFEVAGIGTVLPLFFDRDEAVAALPA